MGTDILELKLVQDLASVNQDPFLLVFMYLHKSYDTLDQGRIVATLEGCGSGTHMHGLLAEFWEQQEVVTRKTGNIYPTSK